MGDEKVQASSFLCSGCDGRSGEEPQEPAAGLGRGPLPAAAEFMDWGQLLPGITGARLVTVSIQTPVLFSQFANSAQTDTISTKFAQWHCEYTVRLKEQNHNSVNGVECCCDNMTPVLYYRDLRNHSLSGSLPDSFGNLTGMQTM